MEGTQGGRGIYHPAQRSLRPYLGTSSGLNQARGPFWPFLRGMMRYLNCSNSMNDYGVDWCGGRGVVLFAASCY